MNKIQLSSTSGACVVGNPILLPTCGEPLCEVEAEADFVSKLLRSVGFEVHALMGQAADKADVQSKIEGAKTTWTAMLLCLLRC